MRCAIFTLAFLGLGGLELAAADPEPTTPSAAPAAVVTDSAAPATSAATKAPPPPAPSSSPASQAAAPKAAAAPALSADEQRLLSQGYKPQMRNGEKIYCRRETELGSRVSSVQHCGTVTQLKDATKNGRDYTEQIQRNQLNPAGN